MIAVRSVVAMSAVLVVACTGPQVPGDANAPRDAPRLDVPPSDAPRPDAALDCVERVRPAFRLIAPLSTSLATSRRPTFRWAAPAGTTAHLEICTDRSCMTLIERITTTQTDALPSTDLPPGTVFWRVVTDAGEASATWQVRVGHHSAPNDTSWGSVPDVNGDGLTDVIVTGANEALFTSHVFVYLAHASGFDAFPTATLNGASVGCATRAGDVNGDGYVDVVSGMSIYLGGPNGLSADRAVSLTWRAGTSEHQGYATSVGDLDRDGYADLVVVDWRNSTASPGSDVLVYYGGPAGPSCARDVLSSSIVNVDAPSVVAANDVNADGFADLIFVDPTSSRVDLHLGRADGIALRGIPIAAVDPTATPFPRGVAALGDVNGDGLSDVAIGAGPINHPGRVYVLLGAPDGLAMAPFATLDASALPPALVSRALYAMAIGDVDADGFADVMLTSEVRDASGSLASQGIVVLAGGPTALTPRASWSIDGDRAGYGIGVFGMGDTNGDAVDDVVIGDASAPPVGVARLYPGSPRGLAVAPVMTWTSPRADSWYGCIAQLGRPQIYGAVGPGRVHRPLGPWKQPA